MQKISKGALANFIPPNCAEIKLRAERRAGGILAKTEKHPAGRPTRNRSHDVTNSPKLADLGITRMQSHRWQAVAVRRSGVWRTGGTSPGQWGVFVPDVCRRRLGRYASRNLPTSGSSFGDGIFRQSKSRPYTSWHPSVSLRSRNGLKM